MEKKWEEQKKIEKICKVLLIKFVNEDCFSLATDMLELVNAIHYDNVLKIKENYFITKKDIFIGKEIKQIKKYCKKYLGMSF